MSTGQADARDVAADTPLTPEARAHLKAAARDVDDGAFTVKAVLHTVRRAIHPDVVGEGVELDEDEAYDLARTLEGACAALQDRVVRGVFARAAGDRPHGRRTGAPSGAAAGADPDDLFNALGLAVAAIGLASDGELVKQNTYGLRAIMSRLAGHLDRIVGREIDARGLDRSDTYARFSDALEPFRREGGGDEPRANRGTKSDGPRGGPAPADATPDTLELPRELAERLVRQVGLLRAADCTLVDMSPRGFVDIEVARRTVREYAARLVGTLGDLEERLGYTDGDALTDRLNEEEEVMEAAKRRELAEELAGGAS